MPTVNLSSFAGAGSQFFDNSGVPLAGGLIYTYLAGTTTPLVSYTSSTGLTAHPNPIVLDSAGRVNEVWVAEGTNCKFVLQTSTNVLIGTYDSLFPIASLPVSIYNGGTGATTAAGARANLGLGTFLVPTGSVIMWPSNTSPTNWKICDGTAISRVTFVDLFSLIGTTFGIGDGSTTFNLPDYRNRTPYGADTYAIGATGGSANAVIVSHTHTATPVVTDPGHSHLINASSDGAIGGTNNLGPGSGPNSTTSSGTTSVSTGITVATSISTVGSSGTNANLPPYLAINFIIKT
jgi:microcystin-dependent protein